MEKKFRYGMLLLCFAIFAVFASWLFFYVQGVPLNGTSRNNRTGILAVETEPEGAEVLVDGTVMDTTPAAIRFLGPGDYDLTVQKTGYFTWHKRLQVLEGKVTWVNPNPNRLVLLKENPSPTVVAKEVQTFRVIAKDTIIYASGNKLVTISGENFTNTTVYTAPGEITSILPAPTSTYALVYGKDNVFYFNAEQKTFIDISSVIRPEDHTEFISDSQLLTLHNGTLSVVDTNKKNAHILNTNVHSFTYLDQQLYLLNTTHSGLTLAYGQLTADAVTVSLQEIKKDLPVLNQAKLYITDRKEIFILGNNNLYRVNEALESVAAGVTNVFFDRPSASLVFTLPGEFSFYNFDEQKTKLISRSSEQFTAPILRKDLNYAFVFHNNTLKALELDDRDHQNTYALLRTPKPNAIAFVSDKHLLVLAEGNLTFLTIR